MLENQILNAESSRETVLHSQFETEIEWENGLQKATKPGLSDARSLACGANQKRENARVAAAI